MFRLRAGTRRQRIFYNQFFYQRLKWRIYDQKNLSIMDGCSRPAPVRPCAGTGNYGFGQRSCGGRHRRRHHSGRRHYEGYDLRCGRSFSIKAAPDNVLVVSFMGYQSHTIKVGTQTRIDVVLKENTQAIDDVIVVAFGTAKKGGFHRFGDRHQIGRHRQVAAVERSAGSGRKGRGRAADQHLGTAGERVRRSASAVSVRSTPATIRSGSWRHALLGRPEQPQPE